MRKGRRRQAFLLCLLLLFLYVVTAQPQKTEQSYKLDTTEEIEVAMEQQFGIDEVELAQMEPELAQKVYRAFSYMYERYPVLYHKITNVEVEEIASGAVAKAEYVEIPSNQEELYPIQMKQQVTLGEREFLNEVRLTNLIRKSTADGHWMEGTDVDSIVVHELEHILLNVIRMERYGLEDFCDITEENADAFSAYQTDVLSMNQTTAQEIVNAAYLSYEKKEQTDMTLEEAKEMISGYASGEQEDGGISYEETIAEAMADLYLHGENAASFSKEIIAEIDENWLFIPFIVSSVAEITQKEII